MAGAIHRAVGPGLEEEARPMAIEPWRLRDIHVKYVDIVINIVYTIIHNKTIFE